MLCKEVLCGDNTVVCKLNELQETLLNHLGFGLSSAASTDPWPLQVRPRTLAVLAEILLLRQQAERDQMMSTTSGVVPTTKRASELIVMQIWTRLMNALTEATLSADTKMRAADVDDINVEHLQLVVFLFHSALTLMQKKSLLLQLCQSIVRIAESLAGRQNDSAVAETGVSRLHGILPLPLTRLLLIVDYMLHYFYDVPPSLIEQVGSLSVNLMLYFCVKLYVTLSFQMFEHSNC